MRTGTLNQCLGAARYGLAGVLLWLALPAGAQETLPAPAAHVDAPAGSPAEAVVAKAQAEGIPEAPPTPEGKGLLDLDLESLAAQPVQVAAPSLQQEVTSVTGQVSSVGKSPAAVFVVTNEMIRRSGATSIPEALRLVPGLHVARIRANAWAISSRGFNGEFIDPRFNNKLLVQIDGRTVYTPLFAGVYWDVQDVLLEDVERIEVIRGPGGTVWGANAVNGIISIITKKAADTHGVYVQSGGGTDEVGFSSFRVGGREGNLDWRVYAKWFERDAGFNPVGPQYDDWRQGRGGFRMDWTPTCEDTITFQGDYYTGSNGVLSSIPRQDEHVSGGNLLTRWTHTFSEKSAVSLQAYYDRADRREINVLDQEITTYDVDLRYHFPLGCRHSLVAGVGYRSIKDDLVSLTPAIRFDPTQRLYDTVSTFVQDEIAVVPEKLFLTLGTKLEYNDFTHFEYQPSLRLLWSPEKSWAAWAAVSRAVRTPSRVDHNLTFPPVLFLTKDFESEDLVAYELGYRKQPVKWFSYDVALFYNQYEDLGSFRQVGATLRNSNDNRGEGYGGEISGTLDVNDNWKLSAWYSYIQLQIHPGPLSVVNGVVIEGSTPVNQAFLMSSWDLGRAVELDVMGRYVETLPAQNVGNVLTRNVGSYISLDVRLGWRPAQWLELSVVGQNLLDSHHAEFGGAGATEVRRGVYGQVAIRW